MPLLHPGDVYPEMLLRLPGGQSVTVPEAFRGDFGVLLFYRGSWCPYCNAQSRAFQRASGTLAGAGVRVAALSVDDEATTAALIGKHGLAFPVQRGHRQAHPRGRGGPGPLRPRARVGLARRGNQRLIPQ